MQKITTFEEAKEFFGISSAVSSSTALKKELVTLKEKRWFFDNRSIKDLEQASAAMGILVDTYHEWKKAEEEEERKKEEFLIQIADFYEKLE